MPGDAWTGRSGQWANAAERDVSRAVDTRDRLQMRKSTILDPRVRRIGIDVQALDEQVAEKQRRKAEDQMREDAFTLQTLEHTAALTRMEAEDNATRRQMSMDQVGFRAAHQRRDQSREFDIWRPDLLKVSRPAREGDSDPRLGASSGQVFNGEDLTRTERLAQQEAQRREWHAAQVAEHEERERQREIERLETDLALLEAQRAQLKAHQATEAARAAVRAQVRDDNQGMATAARARAAAAWEADQAANAREVEHVVGSDQIVERMVPRGRGPQDYRGMTIQEQQAVLDGQRAQVEEKAAQRQREREHEEQWTQYLDTLRQHGDMAEAGYLAGRRAERVALAETHRMQAQEFGDRERHMNKDVYGTNIPEDSYYRRWGQDVR